jgi:hypothetical protein
VKKYLRIMLKGEMAVWFDVPVPDNAEMQAFSAVLQSMGYIVFDKVWVPREEIKYMALVEVPSNGSVAQLRPVS